MLRFKHLNSRSQRREWSSLSHSYLSFLHVIRKIFLCGTRKFIRRKKKKNNPQNHILLALLAPIHSFGLIAYHSLWAFEHQISKRRHKSVSMKWMSSLLQSALHAGDLCSWRAGGVCVGGGGVNVFSPPPSLPPRILMPAFLLLLLIGLIYAGHWDRHQETSIFIWDSILNIYMRSKPHLCIHRKERTMQSVAFKWQRWWS